MTFVLYVCSVVRLDRRLILCQRDEKDKGGSKRTSIRSPAGAHVSGFYADEKVVQVWMMEEPSRGN